MNELTTLPFCACRVPSPPMLVSPLSKPCLLIDFVSTSGADDAGWLRAVNKLGRVKLDNAIESWVRLPRRTLGISSSAPCA
jgi:hypothetical protein